MALENILVNKARVEKVYNRHVKPKSFLEGDLVWKSILPLGFHDSQLGEWSPNSKGPYIVSKVLENGSSQIMEVNDKDLNMSINGKYLKGHYSSIWTEYKK